eukprot:COSAG02_NODE_3157_length_7260_cov_20.933808_8_plen_45_part_00
MDCTRSTPQIELLGYSGQFDYPEFLAEVRTYTSSNDSRCQSGAD